MLVCRAGKQGRRWEGVGGEGDRDELALAAAPAGTRRECEMWTRRECEMLEGTPYALNPRWEMRNTVLGPANTNTAKYICIWPLAKYISNTFEAYIQPRTRFKYSQIHICIWYLASGQIQIRGKYVFRISHQRLQPQVWLFFCSFSHVGGISPTCRATLLHSVRKSPAGGQ